MKVEQASPKDAEEMIALADEIARSLAGKRCPIVAGALASVMGMLIATHDQKEWGNLRFVTALTLAGAARFHHEHPERNPFAGALIHSDDDSQMMH